MPKKIRIALLPKDRHSSPGDIVFEYNKEESLKNNVRKIFALKTFSATAEPMNVVSAHTCIHFSRIRGSIARFKPSDWRYDEQGRIKYTGDPLLLSLHTDSANFNDLEQGWPNPTPEGNYIEVAKVPFSLSYYIIANGNSRVFSTWVYYHRNYDAFPANYQFHCKVNYSKIKAPIRQAIKILMALKPILFLFAKIRILRYPKHILRVCRLGLYLDIEL